MEELFVPGVFHSKLYLMGFFLSFLVMPLAYLRLNKYSAISADKSLKYYAVPLLICSMAIFSTVITPHFHTVNNLIIILPMVWFMVFQVNVEHHFFCFSRGAFLAIASLSLLYGYINDVALYDISIAVFVSALLVLIYKINPKRKNYVNKMINPYVLFTVITSLGLANMGTYAFFFFKTMIAYFFARIVYCYFRSRNETFTTSIIFVKFYEMTKFHFMAWFLTMLTLNPHIYQSI